MNVDPMRKGNALLLDGREKNVDTMHVHIWKGNALLLDGREENVDTMHVHIWKGNALLLLGREKMLMLCMYLPTYMEGKSIAPRWKGREC